ncbi:hypothetical protein MITS9509_02610 [Synechococcus sp. MIT S9509]|uniref:hypothetical protein n=1 Tax=Synechococcus sp. MIT S9509 TaxID=1801630 RepID=UPI0007BBF326|nr:hypothetical protein [Synechococcus sp. MIT S9509]KZR90713.1 hypothetical protein MITS9509_02610 [Synechococcus sp. MIT S9509]
MSRFFISQSSRGSKRIYLQISDNSTPDVYSNSSQITSSDPGYEFWPIINRNGDTAWGLVFGTSPASALSNNSLFINGRRVANNLDILDIAISETSVATLLRTSEGPEIQIFDIKTLQKFKTIRLEDAHFYELSLNEKGDCSVVGLDEVGQKVETINRIINLDSSVQEQNFSNKSIHGLRVFEGDNKAYAAFYGDYSGTSLANSLYHIFHYSSEEFSGSTNSAGRLAWHVTWRHDTLNILANITDDDRLKNRAISSTNLLLKRYSEQEGFASLRYGINKKQWTKFAVHEARIASSCLGSLPWLNAETSERVVAMAEDIFKFYEKDFKDNKYLFTPGSNFWVDGIPMPWNMQASIGILALKLYKVTKDSKYANRATQILDSIRQELKFENGIAIADYWPSEYYSGWEIGDYNSFNKPRKDPSPSIYDDTSHIGLTVEFDRLANIEIGTTRLFDNDKLWNLAQATPLGFRRWFIEGEISDKHMPNWGYGNAPRNASNVIGDVSRNYSNAQWAHRHAQALKESYQGDNLSLTAEVFDPFSGQVLGSIDFNSMKTLIDFVENSSSYKYSLEAEFALDINSDGLISGGKSYQLASDQGAVLLSNSAGTTFNDAFTTSWDVQAATQTNTGFEVLLDGDAAYDGKKYVWTTDKTGQITKYSGWKTNAQAVSAGWENSFECDINSDGLISGGKSYQLASSNGSISLTGSQMVQQSSINNETIDSLTGASLPSGFNSETNEVSRGSIRPDSLSSEIIYTPIVNNETVNSAISPISSSQAVLEASIQPNLESLLDEQANLGQLQNSMV